MFEVSFLYQSSIRKPLPGQFTDAGPGIEDGLLRLIDRVGHVPVVTLQVQPLQTLKASYEPGF